MGKKLFIVKRYEGFSRKTLGRVRGGGACFLEVWTGVLAVEYGGGEEESTLQVPLSPWSSSRILLQIHGPRKQAWAVETAALWGWEGPQY